MQPTTKTILVNIALTVVTGALAGAAVFALYWDHRCLAYPAIVGTDLYLILVLFVGAILSGKAKVAADASCLNVFLPRRPIAILVVTFMFIAVILGFAALYTEEGFFIVQKSKSTIDAIYISFMTLGFSDYSPLTDAGKRIVMWELVNGILLLTGVLSLLISRLGTF